MKLVDYIPGTSTTITVEIGGQIADLILDNAGKPRYYVRIDPGFEGRRFGLLIRNTGDTMAAYPTFVGDGTGRRCNVFLTDPETDPNKLLADGGMYEAERAGTDYDEVEIDGYPLPDDHHMPWRIANGAALLGDNLSAQGQDQVPATEIWVYRRTPVNPRVTILNSDFGNRNTGSGYEYFQPSLGTSEVENQERIRTGVPYNPDATLLARITLVDPARFEQLLTQAGTPYRQ